MHHQLMSSLLSGPAQHEVTAAAASLGEPARSRLACVLDSFLNEVESHGELPGSRHLESARAVIRLILCECGASLSDRCSLALSNLEALLTLGQCDDHSWLTAICEPVESDGRATRCGVRLEGIWPESG
jgi:hypothetical protein